MALFVSVYLTINFCISHLSQWEPWNIFIEHFSFLTTSSTKVWRIFNLDISSEKDYLTNLMSSWQFWANLPKSLRDQCDMHFHFLAIFLNNIFFGNLDDWFASNLKRRKFLLAYRDSFVSLEANCGLGSGHSPLTFPTSASVHAWGSALCPQLASTLAPIWAEVQCPTNVGKARD